MGLNAKAYQSDFVGFIVKKDDNKVTDVEPFLALEDGPYNEKDVIVMQSLLDGSQKEIPSDDIIYSTNIPTFYWSLVEQSGISEYKASNILFGDICVNDYKEPIQDNFKQAFVNYINYVDELFADSEIYEAKQESVLENDDTSYSTNIESPEDEMFDSLDEDEHLVETSSRELPVMDSNNELDEPEFQ